MRLGKYHGLGNDFLVALASDNPDMRVDAEVARSLCDRHRGLGADGLIYGLGAVDPANDASMVLLNADGSRAEISGNGIRCLAQALLRGSGPGTGPSASEGDRGCMRIETDGGTREVCLVAGDPNERAVFRVEMGVPTDGPPLEEHSLRWGARNVSTVDIGNPHLVLEVDDPEAVDLAVEGPALEEHYHGGINVHFVKAPDARHLDLRVWERGAGITEACGSGAVAAVVAADTWGLVDAAGAPVEVLMPGGTVTVDLNGSTVLLSGPSEFVGEVVTP